MNHLERDQHSLLVHETDYPPTISQKTKLLEWESSELRLKRIVLNRLSNSQQNVVGEEKTLRRRCRLLVSKRQITLQLRKHVHLKMSVPTR